MLILEENPLYFRLPFYNICDPPQMCHLFIQQCLFSRLILLRTFFIHDKLFGGIFILVFVCSWKYSLYFILAQHLSVKTSVDIVLEYFLDLLKFKDLHVWSFCIQEQYGLSRLIFDCAQIHNLLFSRIYAQCLLV